MNFGFNFGLGGGISLVTAANIIYTMNLASFQTTATGYQAIDSSGSDGATSDADANASNMVHQNGTDNNVAVPITESVTQTVLYLSPVTREFVLITSLSGSTHDIPASFGELFTMTPLATEADRVKLTADHNLLRKIMYHGLTSPLSFNRDDMLSANGGHYYPGNDWQSGKYIQDVSTSLGANSISNSTFDSDIVPWCNTTAGTITWVAGEAYIQANSDIATGGGCYELSGLEIGETYLIKARMRMVQGGVGGHVSLNIVNNAFNAFVAIGEDITSATMVDTFFIFTATETDNKVYLRCFSDGTATTKGYADDVTVEKCNALLIENFVAANRETYRDENYGPTDRIVEKDPITGRTLDGAGDAEYHGSGGDTIPTRTRTADITIELTPRVVESILLVDTATGDIKSIVTVTGISIDGESTIFNDFDGVVHNYEENEV